MNKLFFVFSLIALSSVFALGQNDHKKGEFFVGYSNGQIDAGIEGFTSVDTGIGNRTSFHGFNTSAVYNFNRYVGVKGDFSGVYNSTRFSFPVTTGATTQTVTFDTDNSLYNVLGGIQVKDNAVDKKFKPFAHALAGIGHAKVKVGGVNCTTTTVINCGQILSESETGLAAAFGGGLDIRLNDRFDLRAFQVDYNPIKFDESTTHNFRFGIGIVIK
ncbi:MAG TPA: outer membrane beta-barrel protein [Pyrinomonadaceae bacterium]|nr:outer membrane beta-barrel protein [Pyrinomonadaceae bacterium]